MINYKDQTIELWERKNKDGLGSKSINFQKDNIRIIIIPKNDFIFRLLPIYMYKDWVFKKSQLVKMVSIIPFPKQT